MTPAQHWQRIRLIYRRRVFSTIGKIENGSVSQDELDKLRNFCAVALMLMGKVQEPLWRKAEREAELAAWLRGELQDETDEEETENEIGKSGTAQGEEGLGGPHQGQPGD